MVGNKHVFKLEQSFYPRDYTFSSYKALSGLKCVKTEISQTSHIPFWRENLRIDPRFFSAKKFRQVISYHMKL